MIINFKLFESKKLTTEFIEKSKKVHGDKYDYSSVDYKNFDSKIRIICTKHGIFEQLPFHHLRGSGCKKCSIESRTSNTEKFINDAKKIHGDRYDYSLVDYKKAIDKVKIVCPDHGIFEQSPNNHLRGNGCTICGGSKKLTTDEFIENAKKVHGDKYDYSLVNYTGAFNKIKIICPKDGHGIFEQAPNSHLQGKGCGKCSKTFMNNDYFIEMSKKIHNDKYDYSLVNYVKSNEKVKIICPIHGIFEQVPNSHLDGQGCPICRESRGERKITNILIDYEIKYEPQKKFEECKITKQLPFDFYLTDYNICIEYDGQQHYEPINHFGGVDKFIKNKNTDSIKTKFCIDNKIPLIRIPYTVKDVEDYLMSRIKKIKDGEYDYEKGFSSNLFNVDDELEF
jgi:hypothetical protein